VSKREQGKHAKGSRRPAGRQTGIVREQLAKERRRRRSVWVTAVAAAVLVIAGLVGWGVYASQRSASYKTPANASADADGLVVGSGPKTVDVYLDFMCPRCREFEDAAGPTLDQLVADTVFVDGKQTEASAAAITAAVEASGS
jgi:protein-disulfide isomerase